MGQSYALTDSEIEWLEEFIDNVMEEYESKYEYMWDNLPRIVTKELKKMKDSEKAFDAFLSRSIALTSSGGFVLEEALEVVRDTYGEKLYLALLLGLPHALGAVTLYLAGKLLKVPEDTTRSEIEQYLEKVWGLIQEGYGGIEGMIQEAFEMSKRDRFYT